MTRAPGSSLGNPNYQGPFGNTLLHGAVVSGDLREVKRLLAAGADPRIANRDGKTPVQAAAILGYARIRDVLQKEARPALSGRIACLGPATAVTDVTSEQNVAMTSDEHREQLLDEALEATFPASDPLAITLPPSSDDNEGDD